MRSLSLVRISAVALVSSISLGFGSCVEIGDPIDLACLSEEARVSTDANGVRHIFAANDLDLACAQGYVHARDRFFQMDATRRQVSGDLAELLGADVLSDDIQSRTIGLRRAAQRSYDAAPPEFQTLLEAYASGVNEFLAAGTLPPEYALLELSSARPWDAVDSLVIGKAISAQLSLDIDIFLTLDLEEFVTAGFIHGFDGQALFSEDVMRSAPMDPSSTIPDATNSTPYLAAKASGMSPEMLARAAAGARRVKEKIEKVAYLEPVLKRREQIVGSNEWGVAAANSKTGRPIIANDPHLALNAPSTFYEIHLNSQDPVAGPMDVSGVGFPGAPGVILGQNEKITWGATTNPMDVTDTFLDELWVGQPECFLIGALACILSEGVFHPVDIQLGVVYQVNQIGDAILDNLVPAPLPPEAQIIATVPFRSFGPVLDITDPSVLQPPFGITDVLVLQYTGFHGTQELQTFVQWNRAQNLSDFLAGLDKFDVGSQNWAYADVEGNLGYFSSAENPLRKDLEQGQVDGLPPYFIRDGSGPNNWIPDPAKSQGQTIPFAVMPYAEMPQTVNPANGFFVNANNDPAGTTLDNNPLNQVRPSNPNALYYLNPGYANGLRSGRITRLVQGKIDAGKKISVHDMKEFQANTQQLDAELMVPFLLAAAESAWAPDAPAELAALGADAEVAEALGRIGTWDFSSPTGIPEGYDASDFFGWRNPHVSAADRHNAVAATLYNVWRAKAIQASVDATLSAFGLSVGSGDALKALHHLLVQSPFTGIGASGVDFFAEPAALSAEDRRDVMLLTALRTTLDALASDDFKNAFGNSTDQDDYLWGYLHRITFDHAFNPGFSIPPQADFENVSPELLGLSRDGAYEVVNASGFSARADGENEFRFGGGPVRRYVGEARSWDIVGMNVIAGGPSGVPGDEDYATQLGSWLTADYHYVTMGSHVPLTKLEETLTPPPAP